MQIPKSSIDRRNLSLCEPLHQSDAALVSEVEALRVTCASRTPMGQRLSGIQRSSSESLLVTVERHLACDASRYSCLELQPQCLFNETDCTQPSKKDTRCVNLSYCGGTTDNCDVTAGEVNTGMYSGEELRETNDQQKLTNACHDIILKR